MTCGEHRAGVHVWVWGLAGSSGSEAKAGRVGKIFLAKEAALTLGFFRPFGT